MGGWSYQDHGGVRNRRRHSKPAGISPDVRANEGVTGLGRWGLSMAFDYLRGCLSKK
jgi:hypothetical protein